MATTFKVTANREIAGKIGKGSVVQVTKSTSNTPMLSEVMEAYKRQLGIEVKNVSIVLSYFTIEKI
jgi:hypothetical protein